ncbi:MAG: MarR family winged helix-turn-helix transcriptional regulator [Cellvibrionaceae bacterium]
MAEKSKSTSKSSTLKKTAQTKTKTTSNKNKKTTGDVPVLAEGSNLLGYHLRRAHLTIWRQFNDSVGHGGLRPGQFGLLSTVENNPGISQIDASRLLDFDKATIVALTLRLEKEGYVTRKQAEEDRRRHELYITPTGKKTLKTLRADLEKLESGFREKFSVKEYEQLISLLERVYQ